MSSINQNIALQQAVSANASADISGCEDLSNDKQKDAKKAVVGQQKVPVYTKYHFWSPNFVKCDGKIIKYDLRALGIWRALVSCSHTIITDWETWQHLAGLMILGAVSAVFVINAGLYQSIGDSSPVLTRISLLISFILSGYITITVNRWDRIRNDTLGALWGALENLNMVVQRVLLTNTTATPTPTPHIYHTTPHSTTTHTTSTPLNTNTTIEQKNLKNGTELALCEELIRLSRLCLILTFKGVQDLGNADQLVGLLNQELVTEEERQWLLSTTPGTRPLVVVSWLEGFINSLPDHGYTVPRYLNGLAGMQLNNIRGGIGATLGAIGAQLPYPYVHIVYWTVQLLLGITAIQSGCEIGIWYYTKVNGDGQFSPDTGTWPESPETWYVGQILSSIAGFLIFALFCEGIMNICAKISNPMAQTDIAFSEKVYASFMYNNCKALRAGTYSYTHLHHAALLGPRGGAVRGGGGSGIGGNGSSTPFKSSVFGALNTPKAGSSGAGNSTTNTNDASGYTSFGGNKQSSPSNNNTSSTAQEVSIMGTLSTHTEGAIVSLAYGMSG